LYISDDLRDNRALIASEDGNSSMVGFAWRYTKILIRDSSASMGREVVSSYNNTNIVTTSGSGSSRTSGSTETVGSRPVAFFAS